MEKKHFIDSNIWIYFFADDEIEKKKKAENFLKKARQKVVSWQVVNEVCENLLRKKKKGEGFIRVVTEFICGSCEVLDFSPSLLELASDFRGLRCARFRGFAARAQVRHFGHSQCVWQIMAPVSFARDCLRKKLSLMQKRAIVRA